MNWKLILLSVATMASAFVPQQPSSSSTTKLRGLDEWKNMELSTESTGADYTAHGSPSSSSLRPVTVLPMEQSQVASLPLPGETTYLQFVEADEVELFETALHDHGGIFAIGLVSSNEVDVERTMLATLPILEIQEYNHMGRELGIFCVARVVAKAKVNQVFWSHSSYTNSSPLLALVYDADDEFQKSEIIAANQVADGIEMLISNLARWERESDDWDDGEDKTTLMDQFLQACHFALQSDPQDYHIPLEDVQNLGKRSWRELKAISWAAFACSKQDPRQRMEALYAPSVLRRLQLARNWLSAIRMPKSSERV